MLIIKDCQFCRTTNEIYVEDDESGLISQIEHRRKQRGAQPGVYSVDDVTANPPIRIGCLCDASTDGDDPEMQFADSTYLGDNRTNWMDTFQLAIEQWNRMQEPMNEHLPKHADRSARITVVENGFVVEFCKLTVDGKSITRQRVYNNATDMYEFLRQYFQGD